MSGRGPYGIGMQRPPQRLLARDRDQVKKDIDIEQVFRARAPQP